MADVLFKQLTQRHDTGDEEELQQGDGIMTAKGTAMGVLFLASLTTGTLPFLLAYCLRWNITNPSRRASRAITMTLAFGGGVLLATTFLHLLPEVRHTIEELQESGAMIETSFSLAELLTCVGFFVIYLVSELVHTYIARQNRLAKERIECALPRCPNGTVSTVNLSDHAAVDIEKHRNNLEQEPTATKHDEHTASPNHHQHSHLHLPDNHCGEDALVSALRGLLIVLALSIHELFEGLALGLESSTGSVWLFFGAIASHKLVLAFCVGIELLVAKTNRWLAVSYILLFAVVSPLGIGIGMVISSNSEGSSIAGVVLQALATGTLLYVVFFEILKKGGSGLLQFVAVLVGFFVMFGLQQITGSDDGHGHGHSHGAALNDVHDERGHIDHSHSDDLRQKVNAMKQAGQLLSQSVEQIGRMHDRHE